MDNAQYFRQKIQKGGLCLGVAITFRDPVVSEALSTIMDFLWIDMEHNPLALADVQGHIMATKGSQCVPLVRVPGNDPVIIKPVLDIGAAGIIAPNVRNADEARRLVQACKYPPDGIRGFGPRRPGRFGERLGSIPDFCRQANEEILIIAQLESQESVDNIDAILAVPGLTSICFGPNDMSGTMGCMGQGGHPTVVQAVEHCIKKARATKVFAGMGAGNAEGAAHWIKKGAQWMLLPDDFALMRDSAKRIYQGIWELTR